MSKQAHTPTQHCNGIAHYPDEQCFCGWIISEKTIHGDEDLEQAKIKYGVTSTTETIQHGDYKIRRKSDGE